MCLGEVQGSRLFDAMCLDFVSGSVGLFVLTSRYSCSFRSNGFTSKTQIPFGNDNKRDAYLRRNGHCGARDGDTEVLRLAQDDDVSGLI